MRGASLSSLPVISCDSGRASLRTVDERSSGDLLLLCAILSCVPLIRLIHKYFPTRSDGAIREYYRPHVSCIPPLAALGVNVRAIVYNPSNESENQGD
nr:MAG TPA: hypothetical protein [Caudoviricetes sp.]